MNHQRPRRLKPFSLFAVSMGLGIFLLGVVAIRAQEPGNRPETAPGNPPVTVTDNGTSFILSNGYLTATINKISGDMSVAEGEGNRDAGVCVGASCGVLGAESGGRGADGSEDDDRPGEANGGERGEVSVKGWSDGKGLNSGGGPRPGNEFAGIARRARRWLRGRMRGGGGGCCGGPPPPSLPPGVQRESRDGDWTSGWRGSRRWAWAGAAGGHGDPLCDGAWREGDLHLCDLYPCAELWRDADWREPLWDEAEWRVVRLALDR